MIGGFQVGPFQTDFQQFGEVVQPRGGTSKRDKKLKKRHYWEDDPFTPVVPEVIETPTHVEPEPELPQSFETLASRIEAEAREALYKKRKKKRMRMIAAALIAALNDDE